MLRGWAVAILCVCVSAAGEEADSTKFGQYRRFAVDEQRARLKSKIRILLQRLDVPKICPVCKGTGRGPNPSRDPKAKLQRTTCDECQGQQSKWREKQEKLPLDRFLREGFGGTGLADPKQAVKWARSRALWDRRIQSWIRLRVEEQPRLLCNLSHEAAEVIVIPPLRRQILFPLHFRFRDGGWHLYDPTSEGRFVFPKPAPAVPRDATVARVLAAGTLELADGTRVRLCGIVVPKPSSAAARQFVVRLLRGKAVRLMGDDYASCTQAGIPLVFVEFEGMDVGQDLLGRGIARCHPAVHMRRRAYEKAQTDAKENKLGSWR